MDIDNFTNAQEVPAAISDEAEELVDANAEDVPFAMSDDAEELVDANAEDAMSDEAEELMAANAEDAMDVDYDESRRIAIAQNGECLQGRTRGSTK